MPTIVHLTTVHPRSDTRIFIKEVQTLAVYLPCKIVLIIADGKGHVTQVQDRISIHDLGRLEGGRLGRVIIGPIRALFAILKLKPEVVHFHDPELIPLGLILRCLGYKIIYDVHEDVPRQTLLKHYIPSIIRKPLACIISMAEWFAGQAFDAIIPATPKIAERFPAGKTTTVQNFPIVAEFIELAQTQYDKRPRAFVYVGVNAKIRGIGEMIRAMDKLTDIPEVRLDLAGEFSPPELVESMQLLSGWQSVHYHGHATRDQIKQFFNTSRAGLVILHPTETYIESYPVKMFEYMSACLPVIASDFPLWRRIIDGAQCGLLVDPLNPEDVAKAMRWILDNPIEAEAMGQRGRKAVEQIYNWDTEAAKMITLYNELLIP